MLRPRLSLRVLLIVVTVASLLFAWQFYYRAQAIRDSERIGKLFSATDSHINFDWRLWGWSVPAEWERLYYIAIPEPSVGFIQPSTEQPLSEEMYDIARRCPAIEFSAHDEFLKPDDARSLLRRCISERTERIRVTGNYLDRKCLSFIGDHPQLKCVESGVSLGKVSLLPLLHHPALEELVAEVYVEDLQQIPALPKPTPLRRLSLFLWSDWEAEMQAWRERNKLAKELRRFPSQNNNQEPADDPPQDSHAYTWLKQCAALEEVTISGEGQGDFLVAIGKHLAGVERLNLKDTSVIEDGSLAGWSRLRHLTLEGASLDDAKLRGVVEALPLLTTLEIDEYFVAPITLTPEGLHVLQQLPNLRRLRLGQCQLTKEHMAAIAQLAHLEELSLEDFSLDDEAIEPLNALARLRRINLERTSASDSVFRNIRGDWDTNRPFRN